MIIPLLDGVDLDRAVVTADALHCPARHRAVRARARRGLQPADQTGWVLDPWLPQPVLVILVGMLDQRQGRHLLVLE
jgi:hypothetical protein